MFPVNHLLYAKVTKYQGPVPNKMLVVVGVRLCALECERLQQVARLGRAEVWVVLGSWLSRFFFRGRSSAQRHWSGTTLLRARAGGEVKGQCRHLWSIRAQLCMDADLLYIGCGGSCMGPRDTQMGAGVL